VKCPQCGRIARVIWISQDEKRAGIQCPGYHSQISRGASQFGSNARPTTKSEKNMVFLMEIQNVASLGRIQR
jgi:hypothetical protein